MNKLKHIAVCGNIGSGKTTLTEKLSKHYGWNPLYESVDDNPYLRDFYQDMTKWAFHVQIYFLNSRLRQINEIHGSQTGPPYRIEPFTKTRIFSLPTCIKAGTCPIAIIEVIRIFFTR